MRKRIEVTARTKQNLVDAFWSLYEEKKIEKITVSNITHKAGYNRGTFYEYFADVYAVLEHIENSLIPSLDELPPVATPTGSIGMPLEAFFKLYRQNHTYYSVLLGERGDPAFAGKLKKTIKPIIMQVIAEKSNDNGTLKELDYILEYTLSAMIGIMSYWFEQKDPLPDERLYELIYRLMEHGVMKQLPV